MQNGLFNIFVSRLARSALLNVDGNVENYVGKYFATVVRFFHFWAGCEDREIVGRLEATNEIIGFYAPLPSFYVFIRTPDCVGR